MDTEDVVRNDFPTGFRGWKRKAVREHLVAVAAEMKRMENRPISDLVSDSVHELIEETEQQTEAMRQAAEAEADSLANLAREDAEALRLQAEETLDEARHEAEKIRSSAEAEAKERLSEAEGAVNQFIGEAILLGERVEHFGDELARSFGMNPSLPPLTKRRFARASLVAEVEAVPAGVE